MQPVRERVFRESFVDLVETEDAETVARVMTEVSNGIYESLNADGSCDSE